MSNEKKFMTTDGNAAAALPSMVINFFSFAIRMICLYKLICCWSNLKITGYIHSIYRVVQDTLYPLHAPYVVLT